MTTYASDTEALTTIAKDALSLEDDAVFDVGAFDPQVYLDRKRITGGNVRAFIGWIQWYVTSQYTDGVARFTDQYAVSVFVRRGQIGDAIDEAKTVRDAMNAAQYRVGSVNRKVFVSNAYPVPNEDGDIDIVQFLIDII